MTPEQFVAKWRTVSTGERATAQSHFNDLCALLGEPTPHQADPSGSWFAFEKGASKAGGGEGWADVWKRGCFGWEYKGKGKDLKAAFRQLQLYTPALEYPPLLIVSDIDSIVIHTAFTGTVQETHVLTLDDLLDADKRKLLKWAFTEPERLKPGLTREHITEQAARRFGDLAQALRQRGHEPHLVAHFLNKLLFCLFAEDADLLPNKLFTRLLESAVRSPEHLQKLLQSLFAAMTTGGLFGVDIIDWFNGGLFDGDDSLPLERADVESLLELARLDWSAIEPAIFGTLFERGLDPAKRSQLGAHYTDRASIMRIIEPVIRQPLLADWAQVRDVIGQGLEAARKGGRGSKKGEQDAHAAYQGFLDRLRHFRVLDPACGSGNFLYLALQTLKDLEHQVMLEAETLGLPRGFPAVGPEAVHGIELNPYAAELARVTVWIGEIQWMQRHGFGIQKNPILKPLDTIAQRDAVLTLAADDVGAACGGDDRGDTPLSRQERATEPDWPEADVIIGNPPFLGGSKMRAELGDEYVEALRKLYEGRVPGGADLVTYWFEKARAQIEKGRAQRAGLVATNSIRGGANRKVLERIVNSGRIFAAWSDEPWINEGAAVRVSLVCFGSPPVARMEAGGRNPGGSPDSASASSGLQTASDGSPRADGPRDDEGKCSATLDGQPVPEIYTDLTAPSGEGDAVDLTLAKSLPENAGICFQGSQKIGDFDIPGELARGMLAQPNPHGRPNSDVLKPSWNGLDVTRQPRDMWIIDFGTRMSVDDAALYEAPFAHVVEHVRPEREINNREAYRKYWWRHGEPRIAMRAALSDLPRYIATPHVAKHRLFVWMDAAVLPDKMLIVTATDSDTTFGILHSRFHELWALRMGTFMGKGNDPRYTPTTTFETFPFPPGLTPRDHVMARAAEPSTRAGEGWPRADGARHDEEEVIAQAARRLVELRDHWLNPPEWTERVPEVVPGYPDRILPRPGFEAELKKRTLTNLYNARPAWLARAHEALDMAVARAYGWDDYTPDMPDTEILRRLLALNLARAGEDAG